MTERREPRVFSRRTLLAGGLGSLGVLAVGCGRPAQTEALPIPSGPFAKAIRVGGPTTAPSPSSHGINIGASNTGPRVGPTQQFTTDVELGPGTHERFEILGGTLTLDATTGPITVRDFAVRPEGFPVYAVSVFGSFPVLMEWGEIDGRQSTRKWAGTNLSSEARWVMRRCNVHHAPTGVFLGTQQTIEECYIHDLGCTEDDAHLGCVKTNHTGTRGGRVLRSHLSCKVAPGFGGGLTACFQLEDPDYEVIDSYLQSDWWCGGWTNNTSGRAINNILDPANANQYWYGSTTNNVVFQGNRDLDGTPVN